MTDIEDPSPAEEAWLFEGGPAPDASTARLERLLALQRKEPSECPTPEGSTRGAATGVRLLLAAAALLLVAIGFALWRGGGDGRVYRLIDPEGERQVAVGQRVDVTGAWAKLEVASLGAVDLETGSRLRILEPRPGGHRFYLERGALEATIDADPRAFQVDTLAGTSVDLGCWYRLEVDDEQVAHLSVSLGRVAFEDVESGRNVYVPEGASCLAYPDRGPTSPTFDLGDPVWRATVWELDFAAAPRPELLRAVASSDDDLGLWHLLGATSAEVRAAAYDRLDELVPAPDAASREAIVASADGTTGTPSHAARRAWLEDGGFWWYTYEWSE